MANPLLFLPSIRTIYTQYKGKEGYFEDVGSFADGVPMNDIDTYLRDLIESTSNPHSHPGRHEGFEVGSRVVDIVVSSPCHTVGQEAVDVSTQRAVVDRA